MLIDQISLSISTICRSIYI